MAPLKLNLDFYSGRNLYSDGDIEDEILYIVKTKTDFSDILFNENRWPILYHLSPIRRNLMKWYDFNNNARLLEIGAGCGALTGLFCEKVKGVVAVELSKKRAEVIATWHRDKSNLEIIVGNLNDISFKEKFDYVTLIGVLEYSGKFTDSSDPYYDFLKQVKRYLKPDGTLILAIENKFGLKYWAGAKEDHSGNYFESIENFLNDDSIRTFGKTELEDLLKLAGFTNTNFYYPVPDYKLPEQIFSDDFLPDIGQIKGVSPNYDGERMVLFNEARVCDNIIINKEFPFFANSFLVFCNNTGDRSKIIYSKFNSVRMPKFQIETSISKENDKLKVLKKPITLEAKGHIDKIYDNYQLFKNYYKNINMAGAQLENGNIILEFVEGKTLERLLIDAILKKDLLEFYILLDRYVDFIMNLSMSVNDDLGEKEDFFRMFGDFQGSGDMNHMRPANVDLNFDNIVLNEDNTFKIFDYEWIFNLDIPVNYIIFRSIEDFFVKYSEYLRKFISQKDLLERYKITTIGAEIYRSAEKRFQDYVLGIEKNYMINESYKKPIIRFPNRKYTWKDILKRLKLLFSI